MRKHWFLFGGIFLLLSWLLVGCGVAQEQYDTVVADLGKAQQELQSVNAKLGEIQTELGTVQSELEATEDELKAKKNELESSQSELETSQTKVSNLTSDLEKAQSELEATKTQNAELSSNIEKSRSELNGIKSENQALEQANDKLKRLIFLRTELCSEKPKAWSPKPKSGNTFKTNETVYVYAEVTGWKYVLEGQELHRNLTVSVKIIDAEGKDAGSKVDSWIDEQELPYSRSGFDRNFGPLEAGNYTAEIIIDDNNSGETITWTQEFEVI